MMKDQLVIDHLLHSRSYLETTSMTTEDPLENTADLLFTTVPAAASSIVAGVTTKLNNDTLEQTTDLLYHAATISLCPRPRATAQLLEERRLALLRAHLTSVSEDTTDNGDLDPLETTTELLYGESSSAPTIAGLTLIQEDTLLPNSTCTSQRLAIACCTIDDMTRFSQQIVQMKPIFLNQIISVSITKSSTVSPDRRIPLKTLQLSHFSGLQTLVLRGLLITDLPPELSVLSPTLRAFVGSYNSFRTWPSVLTKLTKLTSLDLSHNRLEVPPEFRCGTLTNLQVFNLSSNKLIALPSEVVFLRKSMKELYIDRNLMQSIPRSILTMKKLTVLTLFNNLFVSEWDRKWSKEPLTALQHELNAMKYKTQAEAAERQQNLLARRADRKSNSKNKNKSSKLLRSTADTMRIQRGKLTGVWDMRPRPRPLGSAAHFDHSGTPDVPAIFFNHVKGIREVKLALDQLPFLVDYGGELSPMWKLLFRMVDLMTLWVYRGDKEKADSIDTASGILLITRQLNLAFSICNQTKPKYNCWKYTLVYRQSNVFDINGEDTRHTDVSL